MQCVTNKTDTNIRFKMNNTSLKPENATILPYKEYVDSLGKIRKSMFYAELRLITGKCKATLCRWRNGSIRPSKTERKSIAFSVSKFSKVKMSGDELFPENYPYVGAHKNCKGHESIN